MFNLNKTTEQLIYQKTCKDEYDKFVANTKLEFKKSEYPSAFPDFDMNRLVYSLTYNQNIADLSFKYHNLHGGHILGYSNETKNYGEDMINFSQYIDLIKIGDHNFTFHQAMEVIKSVREDLGPEVFYGAVIANHRHVDVNPLHPLVLEEFMKLSEDERYAAELSDYSIIIYTFNDKLQAFKDLHPTKFEVEPEYAADIMSLVAGTKFKQERFVTNRDLELKLNTSNEYFINYTEIITDLNGKEIFTEGTDEYQQGYVVPGQILNLNGLTYPYYGAIYIKGGQAWNLSPMLATNITNPQQLGRNGYKKGSTICTKVGDSRTAEGCKTLNHSNTTSQRNPYTFRNGSMGYAQVAVDVSLSLYFKDYNANKHLESKPTEEPVRKLSKKSLEDFLEEDDSLTKKDYIKYLKERLKEKRK